MDVNIHKGSYRRSEIRNKRLVRALKPIDIVLNLSIIEIYYRSISL